MAPPSGPHSTAGTRHSDRHVTTNQAGSAPMIDAWKAGDSPGRLKIWQYRQTQTQWMEKMGTGVRVHLAPLLKSRRAHAGASYSHQHPRRL
ncbi:hypothetical protein E2C01_015131 [Portunus trituberculatus]|uniref:Uncharacterized protein n=1 Tax=Portunus trituberculatus TaxID=210409 RepID=A0A5B7DM53_PORTR|nr:hypothetical protein [Portunus trituberculatus]